MNRLKLLAAAMLLAAPIACGDEVPPPPPTGSIDGLVSIEGQGIDAVSVTLSNGASATTANGGMFRFDGVEAGAYTVTIGNYPADASFDQTSAAATISTDGETVTVNFPGTFIRTSSIMGTVTVENEGLGGVTVKLSGTGESEWLTDGNGQYAFTGLRAGNYTIEISGFDDEDVSFGSSSSAATVAVGESKVVSFEGTYLRTSGILGQVTADNQPQEAVTVSLQGRGENRSMTTNSAGQYSFDGLRSGDYAIGISGYNTDEVSFDVTSQTVTVAYGETATLPFEGTLLRTAGIMGTVTVEGVGPIEDVTVTIQGNGETKSMPTNSAGMYSFNRLHAGDYSVTISGFDDDEYGFDVTTATVTVALQDTETVAFDGIMLRTAGISGEVTVGDDDTPLSGVTVTVSGGPRDEEHSATTHSDGTYLVENLHAGDYSVVISGYDTREYGFDPTTETVSVGLRETLEVAFQGTLLRTAGVSGRVSVNGMGIPGVTVTLTGEEDRDPENTNADGQFGFSGLAAGDYTLTISEYDAVEYAFEPTREFELELDGAEIMNFMGRALRTATVMGYVTVEDAPLPGIGVTLIMVVGTSGEIVGAMATGDDGGYTFGPLLAGAYLVNIGEYDDEYDFAAGDMQGTAVMTDSTATVNFAATIIRTASVSGRVTIDGDPMKDVTVTLTGDHAPDDNSRMTGDYGMYEFDDLRKGDYTLTISGYDAVDYHFEPTRESFALELGGSEIKNFTGKALRTATVMGYVTVEEAPLPGIEVTLIMVTGATSGEIVGAKATGDNGGYTFGPLLAGAYQVRIGEYDDEYDFAAGDMQVTAVMTDSTATVNFAATIIRTAMVSGMVTIDGEPMPDIEVTLTGDHAPDDNSMMTGDDGSYSFDELRKGTYTVTMTNPDTDKYDFPTVDQTRNLTVGQEQTGVSFAGSTLRRASISGQVAAEYDDGSRTPLMGVTVTLSGDDDDKVTDDNGEYNFPGLAGGDYTVTITNPDADAYEFPDGMEASVTLGDDTPGIQDFIGEHRNNATITGVLFLDEGPEEDAHHDSEPLLALPEGALPEGVTGIPMLLQGPTVDRITPGMSNADGTYTFDGLEAGSYRVLLNLDAVGAALTAAGYRYSGELTGEVVAVMAATESKANFPFRITKQTIYVGAVMGTKDMPTETMVKGVKLALYPTVEDADNSTNELDSETTGDDGMAKFDFLRSADLGPGGQGKDHLVFAKAESGHADLVVADNAHIEITYNATDRASMAPAAARLLNTAVRFQWQVMSNAEAKDGNEPLSGWKTLVDDNLVGEGEGDDFEPDTTTEEGMASYSGTVAIADLSDDATKDYTVKLDVDMQQPDGGEQWVQSNALTHTHNALELPGDNELEDNDLTAIYVTWMTQTLVVGVHREMDDVYGYAKYQSVVNGDHRPARAVGADMTVEVMWEAGRNNRLTVYDEWDHDCDEDPDDERKASSRVGGTGVVKFPCLPADKEWTVRFTEGTHRELVTDLKDIETFGEDLMEGMTLGSFGPDDFGGMPEVRLCSASIAIVPGYESGTTDEHCSTFGYQWTTGTVSGTVGSVRGLDVTLEALTTEHGAVDDDATTSGTGYRFGSLQDGTYMVDVEGNATNAVTTPAQRVDVYHDEFEDDDDEDTDWVGTAADEEEDFETSRLGLEIRGYVANVHTSRNVIHGDETAPGLQLSIRKAGSGGTATQPAGTGAVLGTAMVQADGSYKFENLAADDYVITAMKLAGAYEALQSDPTDNVGGKYAAEDYTVAIDQEDLTGQLPYWDYRESSMGNERFTLTSTGASDKYYNFALLHADATFSGSVTAVDNEHGGIAVELWRCVTYVPGTSGTSDCRREDAWGSRHDGTTPTGRWTFGDLREGLYFVNADGAGYLRAKHTAGIIDDDATDCGLGSDRPERSTDATCDQYRTVELYSLLRGKGAFNNIPGDADFYVYSSLKDADDEATGLAVTGVTTNGVAAGSLGLARSARRPRGDE